MSNRIVVISPANRSADFEKAFSILFSTKLQPANKNDVLAMAPKSDLDFGNANSYTWRRELADAIGLFRSDKNMYLVMDDDALPNATREAKEMLSGDNEAQNRFIALSAINDSK